MNYDGLLSQITDDKLSLFEPATTSVQEGAVEEEQAAAIQTIQVPAKTITSIKADSTKPCGSKSEACTPQRKISTSSRFMNAFQQLYSGSSNSNINTLSNNSTSANTITLGTTSSITSDENEVLSINATGRTPTKGMESKLLSMWHNVKYGWSGKLKSNFSKEQPVWLLGRCYHRKYTPPSSMESSMEMTTSSSSTTNNISSIDSKVVSYASNAYDTIQNILPVASGSGETANETSIYPPLQNQVNEIVVPQELGMDAVENQIAENPWEEGIDGFRRDFYSRLWMTYRREFPIMNGSNYTSDCGWGCMLRSGQMLLAQGLICHFLGRNWRFDPDTQLHSTFEDNMHKKIIKWFGDSSSKSSPFSIHALVSLGEEMGKKPGDWYGPASVSYLLRQALRNAALENADFDNIVIYVAKDCTIYMQDVQNECYIPEQKPKQRVPWNKTTRNFEINNTMEKQQHWKSLIVLIPLRLGTEKLNPVYAHCLKLLLSTEYCIGVIGGRPKHSLYFVGFQEDKLIHLDPHYCQEMVDVNQENFPVHSFHCKSPRKLKTSKIDPSCCIGFYCQTKADFDNFVESVQLYLHPMRCASGTIDKILHPSQQMPNLANSDNGTTEINYPLFTFSRGRCTDYEKDNINEESPYYQLQQHISNLRQELDCTHDDEDDETEEFVLL